MKKLEKHADICVICRKTTRAHEWSPCLDDVLCSTCKASLFRMAGGGGPPGPEEVIAWAVRRYKHYQKKEAA